jgi:methylmalonyl-CoA mutase
VKAGTAADPAVTEQQEPPVPMDVSADPAALRQARDRWRSAVAGVLAKTSGRQPSEFGDEPERRLDTPVDGFAIRPLYTALDALPERPLPGRWPYVRGADPLRDVNSGWKVAEIFPAETRSPVTDGNAAMLAALADGVSALVVRIGDNGVAPGDLGRLLDGVYLDLVPVLFKDAGAGDYTAAAEALLALVDGIDPGRHPALAVDLGADPLTAPLGGASAPAVDEVLAVATRLAGHSGAVRAITVDGPAFHNLGDSAVGELAGTLAAAVAYLRLLNDAGVPVADALGQLSLRLAADDDQFVTIAKFRAARQLWARVAEVLGAPAPARSPCTPRRRCR